jgi:hypothetical protein
VLLLKRYITTPHAHRVVNKCCSYSRFHHDGIDAESTPEFEEHLEVSRQSPSHTGGLGARRLVFEFATHVAICVCLFYSYLHSGHGHGGVVGCSDAQVPETLYEVRVKGARGRVRSIVHGIRDKQHLKTKKREPSVVHYIACTRAKTCSVATRLNEQ